MFVLKGFKGPVQSVAFSKDGGTLLTVGGYAARSWDLAGRSLIWAADVGVYQARFTPDERAVLTVNHFGRPGLFDAASGRPLEVPAWLDVKRGLRDVTFSPGGRRMVAVDFANDYAMRWWGWPGGEDLPASDVNAPFRAYGALAYRPDGAVLVTMSPSGVRLHEAESGRESQQYSFPVVQGECRLAFAPDGRQLAMASGTRLSVLNPATGEEIATLRQERKFFLALAYTPDGRYLATVSNEETVKFWDTRTWALAAEFAWQVGGLRCLAFSHDGMLAAAGGTGRKVVVWDVDL